MSCDSQKGFCCRADAEEVVQSIQTFRLNTCCFKQPADSMTRTSFSSGFAISSSGRDYRKICFWRQPTNYPISHTCLLFGRADIKKTLTTLILNTLPFGKKAVNCPVKVISILRHSLPALLTYPVAHHWQTLPCNCICAYSSGGYIFPFLYLYYTEHTNHDSQL